MWQEPVQRYLLTNAEETDPGFRDEVRRVSHFSLRVIGSIEVVATLFMVSAYVLLDPQPELVRIRLRMGILIVLAGFATIAAARAQFLYNRSRIVACVSGVYVALLYIGHLLHIGRIEPSAFDFIPGTITLIMLVTVAAVPLRPLQTLSYGSTILGGYIILGLVMKQIVRTGPGLQIIHFVFVLMLTLLSVALSAVLYEQRRSSWSMHMGMLQASEKLRQAETRNLLAQNGASVGRLAAALSHELNSPIGALVSAVDTLLLLAARQATSTGENVQRLVVLQNDLRRTIRESSDRLKQIVARMQRFTNLDKAEVQAACINDLLTDVTALLESNYTNKAHFELNLQPIPKLTCRPQQLSAVFSNLLGNAVEASEDDSQVRVSTRRLDSHVQVDIEDNGRGLEPEQVSAIFDPGFRVANGRVAAGNWSMFSSRQIIREHGGDILIHSQPGDGTRVSITLPLEAEPVS